MQSVVTMPLYLVVPCHLPISATVESYRQALHSCYLPLVEALEKQPNVRVTLHLGGHLLDMLARHDEQVLLRLKTLCQSGQLEILGGLFYGGPVALLPERDVRGQIAMSQEFWESFIGVTPQGIYLPQLAWAPELPRLLEDSGILYSFMGSNQRMPEPHQTSVLGRIERGGQRLYTFTLDYELSRQFAPDELPDFMSRLSRRHAQELAAARPLLHGEKDPWGLGLCLPAELFGLWGMGHDGPKPSIEPLLSALAEHPQFDTELPLSHFTTPPRVVSVALGSCYAPIVPEHFNLDPLHDWSQFPGHFVEADTLYRRMLRASRRLSDMIARMEDEQLEASWSDTLATAQRQVFAAQSIDGLGRGLWPGFSDPDVRDAVYKRIMAAEAAMDGLLRQADGNPWPLHIEHKDLDGDRVPDVFIGTPAFNVWLLPGRGGALRTIELKKLGSNICDVGSRREDPFRVQAVLAPLESMGDACSTSHLRLLPRKGPPVGQTIDVCERSGIRDWLLPHSTSAQELISGHVRSLADIRRPWTIIQNESSAHTAGAAPTSHHMALTWDAQLSVGGTLHLHKEVVVHGDRPQIDLSYTLTPQGDDFPADGLLWAVEMPWRFGLGTVDIKIDGVPMSQEGQKDNPRLVQVGAHDTTVTAQMAGIDDLWWAPRSTLVREPDGFIEVPVGSVTVAVARVHDRPRSLSLTLRF